MAEEQETFEKTEEPTPKRREDARQKGQVTKSKNVTLAATLLAATLVLYFVGWQLLVRLGRLFIGFFSLAGIREELAHGDVVALSINSGLLLLPVFIPLFAGVTLIAIGAGFLQTSFLWTLEPLTPDLKRLDPLAGLRRMFSPEAAARLVESLLSVLSLGAVGFFFLYSDIAGISSLISLGVRGMIVYVSKEGILLLALGVMVMVALATLDYFFQRSRTEKKLRMSRQELKEELRQQEGDPLIRTRLRSLRQKMARQRMMADVAKADVIIVNPQELAVALRYQIDGMAAPQVVGKGAGFIAHKIREVARQNGIPLVENRPLARLLYQLVDVGQQIPDSLYRAVAEVLAYVYRLRRRDPMANGE